MSWVRKFSCSWAGMKNVRVLTGTALLIGLNIILGLAGTLYLTNELRIGFGFLTAALCGAVYGPSVAMVSGAITDVLGYLVQPVGAYFPGFTVTAILGGLFYGMILYQSRPTLVRCFIAKGLVNLVLNTGLNTLWHSVFFGKAAEVLLPARFLKNLCLWPIEALILFAVLTAAEKIFQYSDASHSGRAGRM